MPSDPNILVDLTTASSDFEAQVIVQALEAQGIPARAFTTASSMLQWQMAPGHAVRISVRRQDLAAAKSALRAIRAESVDLDWDEVDTGDSSPATEREHESERRLCRGCGYDLGGLPNRVCPECGTDLRERLPVTRGRQVPIFWLLLMLVLLVGLLVLGRNLTGVPVP